LLQYFSIWFFSFFLWFFFQTGLCRFYFFLYWAGWEFSFVFFSKITLWIATMFPPHDFCFAVVFLHMFFLKKLSLSNLFFQYWAGWELSFSFPNIFFFQNCLLLFLFYFLFFLFFFQNCFCRFYFFNIELVDNLAL
jgi:hypothetical protein